MKRKYVIPIFVPHLGCPNDCIFCNQKSISGQKTNMTKEKAKDIIDNYLKSIKVQNSQIEIAFYGGSFTAIDEKIQNELLELANTYIKEGKVESIRISTRPDYITKEILKRLKKYNVKTIELGVQSASDYILKRSNRGHTFEDVKKASKLIRWNGFILGHQMMVGLPESTRKDEIETAKKLIKLKPKMVRIYPVLVVKNTKLEKAYSDYFAKEGQKFQKANDVAKAAENYTKSTQVSNKQLKARGLLSLGTLYFNNGASILQKATPYANSEKEKYEAEKAKALADFRKAQDYLKQAATIEPTNEAVKETQKQVADAIAPLVEKK